eukprot:6209951-Pleurochrysis_carterae.AAC.1
MSTRSTRRDTPARRRPQTPAASGRRSRPSCRRKRGSLRIVRPGCMSTHCTTPRTASARARKISDCHRNAQLASTNSAEESGGPVDRKGRRLEA